MVEAMCADGWVGQGLDPVAGELEVVVRVDPAQPGRHILVAQGGLDADLGQLLLRVLAKTAPLFAVRRQVMHDLEPHAIGAAFLAGVVEQLVGQFHAVGDVVVLHVRGVQAIGLEVGADRPRRRASEAEPDVVQHKLAVHGVGHRLTHLHIVERRLGGIEVQLQDGRLHLIALGRRRDMRQGLQPLHVYRGDGIEAAHVRLLCFDRRRARARVGDEASDDAVQMRQAGLAVIGVAVKAHELALLPFHELERAGSHRLVGVGVARDVARAEDMLGQHWRLVRRQCHHHVGRRLAQAKDCRQSVGGVHRRHRAEGVDAARVVLLEHVHHGELHVGATEWLAIMKLDAGQQLERHCLPV